MLKKTIQQYCLEALEVLLTEKPYNKISVRDIANKVGISTVTFYKYFDSKADLYCKKGATMEITYRNVTFRESDGSCRVVRVPTISIPDDFYDKAYAEWLKEHSPADYLEYMRIVEDTFVAML